MAGIRYTAFSGLVPRTAPRLLGQSQAQVAFNLKAKSGHLRPMRAPKAVVTPIVAGIKTIYRLESSGVERWLAWSKDINVVLAPGTLAVSPDEFTYLADQTWYFTGDNEPRISATSFLAISYPPAEQPFALGSPAPEVAPTGSHAGGSSPALNRSFRYTFVLEWFDGTQMESAPSPTSSSITGKETDGTWTVNGLRADVNNDGTVSAVVADNPVAGQARVTLNDVFGLRIGNEIAFSSSGVSGLTGIEDLAFTIIDIDTVNKYVWIEATIGGALTGPLEWNRVAPYVNVNIFKRVYWSNAGIYQLVLDNIALATTSVNVPGNSVGLGAVLPQTAEDMPNQPPTNLRGLVQHPSGSLLGFFDNKVCASEPWKPWSWPTKYQFPVNYPIVGIGLYDTSIVIATTQTPYRITGTSADGFSQPVQIDEVWPCTAKRSVTQQSTFGVSYATPFGIALIGVGGLAVASRDLYTVDEWKKLRPETMFSAYYDGALYIGYQPDDSTTRVIVMQPGEATALYELNVAVQCLYSDGKSGKLYAAIADTIYELDASDADTLPLDWMSREEVWIKPIHLTTFKVEGDYSGDEAALAAQQAAYDATIAANTALLPDPGGSMNDFLIGEFTVNGSSITTPVPPQPPYAQFTLYVDGDPIFTDTVMDSKAHRIDSPRDKYDVTAVRVSGTAIIKSVLVAETMKGLEQL